METIRAKGKFHAAHRQLGYDGKCRFVHGHTWRGDYVLKTERFPRDPDLDMSIDFGVLKDIFKNLDHKMLISESDDLFQSADLFEPAGVVVIPGTNPSVENVALYCMNEAVEALARQFPDQDLEYLIQVTIQETDNNIFTLERTVVI
mgnify:FL=1